MKKFLFYWNFQHFHNEYWIFRRIDDTKDFEQRKRLQETFWSYCLSFENDFLLSILIVDIEPICRYEDKRVRNNNKDIFGERKTPREPSQHTINHYDIPS